jgi:hypothetical protein
MHSVRAKVNPTGPFNAAKIGIDGDGVENAGVKQFREYAATPFGFDMKDPFQSVVESDL